MVIINIPWGENGLAKLIVSQYFHDLYKILEIIKGSS